MTTEARKDDAHGRKARCYLRECSRGTLSTISRRIAGYPYGSAVPFVLDHAARPVILVSLLAEHTRNLLADPRASLIAREEHEDIQSGARLTLVGDACPTEMDDHLYSRFVRFLPAAGRLLELGGFSFWRIEPVRLRFIAGFGSARWISAQDYAPPINSIGEHETEMVARANDRFAGAMRTLCTGPLGYGPETAIALGVDCDGIDLRADSVRLRFDFPNPAVDRDSIWSELVEMMRGAVL